MAAPTRKNSNDIKGRQAAELAAKHAEEQKTKAKEMSMMTAEAEREFEEQIIDTTAKGPEPVVLDEVVEVGVELADDTVVVRVAEDIDRVTFGYGNTYDFKAGGKYRVPKALADRLQSLGLLYERL